MNKRSNKQFEIPLGSVSNEVLAMRRKRARIRRIIASLNKKLGVSIVSMGLKISTIESKKDTGNKTQERLKDSSNK